MPGSGRTTLFKLLLNENTWNYPENASQNLQNNHLIEYAKVCYFNERASFFPGKLVDSITTFGYDLNNESFADVCDELGIQKYIDNIPNRLEFKIDANQTNLSFRTSLMMDIARAISAGCTYLLIDYSLDSLDESFAHKLSQLCLRKNIGIILSTRNDDLIFSHSIPIVYGNFDPSQLPTQSKK